MLLHTICRADELTSHHNRHALFQLQIAPDQKNIPLTRDYISDSQLSMVSYWTVGA